MWHRWNCKWHHIFIIIDDSIVDKMVVIPCNIGLTKILLIKFEIGTFEFLLKLIMDSIPLIFLYDFFGSSMNLKFNILLIEI